MTDSVAVRGVLVPLGLLFAAFALWIRSSLDRSLGPLDFDAATRLVVAIWVAAPVVGGGLSADVEVRDLRRAAATLGIVIGVVVAFFISVGGRSTVLTHECAALAGSLPPYWIGSIGVGAVVGIGMATAEVVMTTLTRRSWWLIGAPVGAAINFAASAAAAQLLYRVVGCM
jgi:hypothetical protein